MQHFAVAICTVVVCFSVMKPIKHNRTCDHTSMGILFFAVQFLFYIAPVEFVLGDEERVMTVSEPSLGDVVKLGFFYCLFLGVKTHR